MLSFTEKQMPIRSESVLINLRVGDAASWVIHTLELSKADHAACFRPAFVASFCGQLLRAPFNGYLLRLPFAKTDRPNQSRLPIRFGRAQLAKGLFHRSLGHRPRNSNQRIIQLAEGQCHLAQRLLSLDFL